MEQQPILAEIEAFIAEHQMAESTFGRKALGDWRLIPELRGSADRRRRRLWPETEAQVRKFMAEYVPEEKAPAQDAAA